MFYIQFKKDVKELITIVTLKATLPELKNFLEKKFSNPDLMCYILSAMGVYSSAESKFFTA